MMILLKE